ncbi:hypothetical protein BDZ97DRAFT_1920389 [Flammula alnicola]|nr:hypothetical protein BDZ97DRAFT_1920389 [Flammula alnicola]
MSIPLFEAEAAVFTAILATLSLLTLLTSSLKLGQFLLRFPAESVIAGLKGDPFNIAKEEDFSDGFPTRSTDHFWAKMLGRPPVHYPQEKIYSTKTLSSSGEFPEDNVSTENVVSLYGTLFFSYATRVFFLGRSKSLITFDQLPLLPANLRAAVNLSEMKYAMRYVKIPFGMLTRLGSGFQLAYPLLRTLVRKDVPSSSSGGSPSDGDSSETSADFSSKAEVMTLMTTDVGRARELARHIFTLTDFSIGVSIGTYMLYNLLGVSAFVGLTIAVFLVPLNRLAGKFVVAYQQNVMKCRDERVALTNEFLGAIRMIKSMAWERSFEKRILKVRARELKYQKQIFRFEVGIAFDLGDFIEITLKYDLRTLWNSLENSIPLLFGLGCFWHFAVVRREELTPTIAFTAIVIFDEIKYALNELPEFLVEALQAFVSLRRIETYLNVAEVKVRPAGNSSQQALEVALHSAMISWPQIRASSSHAEQSISTPRTRFSLINISTTFPRREISLICGKIGSGKTLLLLALLGEADVLAGHVSCPRSAVDSYAFLANIDETENWTYTFYFWFQSFPPANGVLREKQLLCMARALLRRSKVLLMDEATASVDYATDEIISKTIRKEFADSTIITIAHRLRTVIDYDRIGYTSKIMVMDEGKIVELDSPRTLINDKGSRFHMPCKAAGPEEFARLMAMAR